MWKWSIAAMNCGIEEFRAQCGYRRFWLDNSVAGGGSCSEWAYLVVAIMWPALKSCKCCKRDLVLMRRYILTGRHLHTVGGGDSSVVRAPDSWLKGRGFESLLERRENFLLQGRLSVLTLISVSVPPPCYHSSTYKIPVILPKVQVAGYS